jgi:hypothetical protein
VKGTCPSCGLPGVELPCARCAADPLMEAAARLLARLASGRCPHCAAVVDREEQVGRCVYAHPCGCRMGVGRARSAVKLAALRLGARQ